VTKTSDQTDCLSNNALMTKSWWFRRDVFGVSCTSAYSRCRGVQPVRQQDVSAAGRFGHMSKEYLRLQFT